MLNNEMYKTVRKKIYFFLLDEFFGISGVRRARGPIRRSRGDA